ncbi:MAG: LCP family protein [Lachnospiraceae bacterium]
MSKKQAWSVFGRVFVKVLLSIFLIVLVGVGSFQVTRYFTGRQLNKESEDTETGTEQVNEQPEVQSGRFVTVIYQTDIASKELEDITVRLFNTKTSKELYILVPATTEVAIAEDIYQRLLAKSANLPQTVRLCDLSDYFADSEDCYMASTTLIQSILGINKIDFYEVMSAQGMVSVVNLLDPVEYKIPFKMKFKNKDGINEVLKKGKQTLIGNQAVGLLHYTEGFENPIQDHLNTNVTYWNAYYKQLAKIDDVSEMQEYYQKYYSYVDGTVSYEDIKPYISKITATKEDQVTYQLLPGSVVQDYYAIDETALDTLVQEYQDLDMTVTPDAIGESDENGEDDELQNSHEAPTYTVKVVNAAMIAGTAGRWQERLMAAGYRVISIDTASYQRGDTQIVVRSEGMGEELLDYFPQATIEVGDPGEADVTIYVGIADAE